MRGRAALLLAAVASVTGACDRQIEVDHPFYLMTIDSPPEYALFRCPQGRDQGCAIDGLPEPRVIAAGANENFVAVARLPLPEGSGPIGYYYFARVPNETSGWGANPERIVGPLDEAAFSEAKSRLGLPELTVTP